MLRALSCLVLWWSLWGGTPTAALAQDLIVERAVLPDPAGTLSVDTLVQSDFVPLGPILNAGYTSTVYWLRLRIQARAPGQAVELRIRPSYLDDVRLFEPDTRHPGQWRSRATGDTVDFVDKDRSAATLGFALTLDAPLTTVYLRLETTSNAMLNVEALDPREARAKDARLDVLLVLYLGFMVALLFWAANDYLLRREPVVGLFLVYQLTYCVYSLAVMGFVPMLLPQLSGPGGDRFTSLVVCLTPLLSLLFHRVLLGLFGPPRWALRGLEGLILLDLAALALLVGGYTRPALQFNSMIILLAAPTFVALALLARQEAAPGLRVIRVVYGLQGLSLLFSMLPFLGWVSATEWSLQATLAHGFISAFLMFLLLHLRSRAMGRQAQQAAVDLAVARKQLGIQQQQKQQQERFVAMLTHELKTPMAVIRMALGKLQLHEPAQASVQRALADMGSVIEHCQQADQLEQAQWTVQSLPSDMGQILQELQSASGEGARLLLQMDAPATVHTDPQLLRQVLGNLVGNALKYAAPDSAITITVQPWHDSARPGVRIAVRNQVGPAGLPDPQRVFEKYYRSPGARRKTGSGLGLYLVHSYMHLLGGWVAYAEVDGQVEFSLWMPC